MRNKEVHRAKSKLDNLFSKCSSLSKNSDLEIQAHWARYLCVLTSGFIESSVRTLYKEYARNKAGNSAELSNFIQSHLEEFNNPKMDKILKTTSKFSRTWEKKLRDDTNGELKDSIDSIVSIRHLIAHGRDSGITFATIKSYYQNAIKVIELIEELCNM